MGNDDRSIDRSLATGELLHIDKICREYESLLRAGMQPDVKNFLQCVPESGRAALLRELKAIEADYRSASRQAPVPAATPSEFIRTLTDCGLMTPEEVRSFVEGLPREQRPETAEGLAKEMCRRGKLTRFQAQAIYQKKTRGLVIGNYVVLDRLGKGGMGAVYKARHRRMDRIVALKVLPSAATRSPEAVRRFQREARAAARLSHPNIVTAYDADEAQGVHFLAMELVDGHDLHAWVKEQGPLPVAQAVDYVLQAATGLEYAHRQGIVHRDIKPRNLILDTKGTVKILDMGLARIEDAMVSDNRPIEDGLTASGDVMGTADFMAPEQALDTRTADARADVYSLGCTLYALIAGKPPYPGDTLTKKILAHRSQPIPSLRSVNQAVSQSLDAVFQKMLAKTPEERQQSMTEVIADLRRCVIAPEEADHRSPVPGVPCETTVSYRGEPVVDTRPVPPPLPTSDAAYRDASTLTAGLPEAARRTDCVASRDVRSEAVQTGLHPFKHLRLALAVGLATTVVLVSAYLYFATSPPAKQPEAVPSAAVKTEAATIASIAAADDQAKRNSQTKMSLKAIAVAMHMHHDAFRTFPPAASRAKDGRPLLSWRVRLLPFLDQQALYNDFHHDEPWDSPHNQALVRYMPPVYSNPARKNDGTTSLMVFVGEGTPFGDARFSAKGPSLMDIVDGVANTVMVIDAGPDKAVPWTKPEDIPFDREQPFKPLGTLSAYGLSAVLFDGSVRTIRPETDTETLRALITYGAHDRVLWSDLQ